MSSRTAIEPENLAEPAYSRVCERLRQDILSGVFGPGQRLKIAALSEHYGLSQMPVREALQKLQGEGLIVIAPNRGASVRTVDERFIRNIYDLRAAVEVMLVRRCIDHLKGDDTFPLYAIQSRFEDAAAAGDIETALGMNKNLHRAIYRIADNPEALETVERYWDLLGGLRKRYGFGLSRVEAITAEHRQLLRAIDARDRAQAESVTWEHAMRAQQDLLSQWRAATESTTQSASARS
ncbi:MAG: GntR family transcriptional regulator [Bryobacteraceae bacterium]